MAHEPQAITIFGSGMASYVFKSAVSMFFVTGPVTNSPSACLGEATNCIPNLPISQPIVLRTFVSASQALHPPALTSLNFRDF